MFWHLPSIFDYSQLHESVHVLQHLSFIAVGISGFLAARTLGESFNLFTLLSLSAIMGFAGLFFSVLNKPIYQVVLYLQSQYCWLLYGNYVPIDAYYWNAIISHL